ncbi:hypothetical protein O181_026169 [Austropuccinia psidii MF-1]|uniref:Uncharacterized protein n=1 Tax=Austropuccinia psidii MF-1 TaxID=1389203 RepID=A0A9Q3CLW9_9BASI|nr:hypothetical protein [Austropuccinia psidii MF-1]
MEIDRRKSFRFSEWAAGSGTHTLMTLNNKEQKLPYCGEKPRSPELESQLEEPWLTEYKDNEFFPYRWTNLSQREAHKCPHSGGQGPHIPDPSGMS